MDAKLTAIFIGVYLALGILIAEHWIIPILEAVK